MAGVWGCPPDTISRRPIWAARWSKGSFRSLLVRRLLRRDCSWGRKRPVSRCWQSAKAGLHAHREYAASFTVLVLPPAIALTLKAGVHRKTVQQTLGHRSIQTTLNTYSHAIPGLQEKASDRLEGALGKGALQSILGESTPEEDVVRQSLDTEAGLEPEPHRSRTCNLLIKSQLLCQLS